MYSIYIVTNTTTGKVYVGRTNTGSDRRRHHFGALTKGSHRCRQMQADFDNLGPKHFEYTLIEDDIEDAEAAKVAERAWVNAFPEVYNTYLRDGPKPRFNKPMKSLRAVQQRISICPRCGTAGKSMVMRRWHFDRCRTVTLNTKPAIG